MDYGLQGKTVLVTGGTRGIGRAVVLAFAREGAQVLACHRQEGEHARALALELKELGDDHLVVRADVTDPEDARRLAGTVRAEFGCLDVLVNNVGVNGRTAFGELSEQEWHRVLAHNVTSAYLVTQAMLNVLVDGSSIVTIGAAGALRGGVNGAHYTASKAALIGLTRGLCKELGPRRIRVNTVAPGLTETVPGALPAQVVERVAATTALGRICRPEDVAGAVLFLAGDAARYISGVTLNVDGGV